MNGSAATLYGDDTFAEAGFALASGNNTFTAVAKDDYGRQDTTYYTNDPLGSLTYIKYPHTFHVQMKYDWLNRLTNMVDGLGTTVYGYTAAGQLLTEDGPFANDTVTNTYSNRQRVALDVTDFFVIVLCPELRS
ncbi:MAG TPA: hypothetical protein VG146_13520 [Verrucomicrobiae bacterium]|nr:hypothetical protein [Verrucomicrobiae bacterium]